MKNKHHFHKVWFWVPAIMLSVVDIRWSTCWMSPTSVHACRLRTLFLRMAVKMLQTSAWQLGSHLSNSSTMHTMLSGSWMMKFISRSNWPPTSWRRDTKRSEAGVRKGKKNWKKLKKRKEKNSTMQQFSLLSPAKHNQEFQKEINMTVSLLCVCTLSNRLIMHLRRW